MGSLRTIFAVAVVFSHTWPGGTVFVGGQNAVQLFYIISGFLISYVLTESKSYSSIKTFYVNRYLRLFPIYFAVAILTGVALLFSKHAAFSEVYRNAPIPALVLLVSSNVFIFFQDWVLFSGVENGGLVFVQNFHNSDATLVPGLLVPQAWTLGIELTFYLIAPFVLPNRRLLLTLLAVSLTLRAILVINGIGTEDPWTYRFFPTELAFFLFGALSHQILLPLYRQRFESNLKTIASMATFSLIFISLFFFVIPLDETVKTFLLFLLFALLLPFTFIFQNSHSWDSWIGNLSYPIYVGHMLVVWVVSYCFKFFHIDNVKVISLVCVAAAVVFAISLNRFIGEPFEKIRARIKTDRNQ